MTKLERSVLVLLFAVVAMLTVTSCAGERRCIDVWEDMGLYCQNYLMHPDDPKILPSDRCCDAVQQIDIPCLCSFVDALYEKGVSMPKLVYVMDACQKPLRPGCKCGIYTVPSSGQQDGDC
ncbi:hypothetical protein EJB05_07801 [Eragrostis curvula]|uniref:Bifunctional inhibitor/plant lipid transfer protein/seed storage helical domain-containing protein n=1 Tax=Eragrostis curvula TaxID=38414 RepID=A0A5J9WLN0_9POAL|nr:hypothetical protein EJB05_07801 [Eragrostis curvula]